MGIRWLGDFGKLKRIPASQKITRTKELGRAEDAEKVPIVKSEQCNSSTLSPIAF